MTPEEQLRLEVVIAYARQLEAQLARVEALIAAGEAGERVVEFSTLRAALRGEP